MPSLVEPVVPTRAPHLVAQQPVIDQPTVDFKLRPWRRGDAAQLKVAFRDPQIQRWCLHKVATIPEGRDWIDRWNIRWRKGTGASWAIVERRRPDVVLGQIGFRSLYLADGLAEISCWIMPGSRRRHLGTEATRMLAEWALGELGLERLELVHSTRNSASCPVALRAGFRIEGVKRHLQRHADGFHDMCLHSRIRSDDGEPITPRPPGTVAPAMEQNHRFSPRRRILRRFPLLRINRLDDAGGQALTASCRGADLFRTTVAD